MKRFQPSTNATNKDWNKKNSKKFWWFKKKLYLCTRNRETNLGYEKQAEIAQLVEHNLAKVRVASSSLVFRSLIEQLFCGNSSVGRA